MVKRRPTRPTHSIQDSRTRVFSPESLDCARYISGVKSSEKYDLQIEKSFMLSSDPPIVEINPAKFKNSIKNQSATLRLPRTNFNAKPAESSQHYVFISSKSLAVPLSGQSNLNDASKSISVDLVDLSAKELAEREATVNKKVRQLKARGLWMRDRLPKCMEPQRTSTHWDFLLSEAIWLAEDFRQERMWKLAMAKRVRDAFYSFLLC